ncbi:MAG: HD domain-containing phosphohydrolase [Planctomycetota bacterium]
MRCLSIDEIKPGTKLAEPIRGPGGIVLLQAGCELTPTYLAELRARGMASLYIDDKKFSDVNPIRPVAAATRATVDRKLRNSVGKLGDKVANLRESLGEAPDIHSPGFASDVRDALGPDALQPVVESVDALLGDMSKAVGDDAVLTGLGSLRTHDSYTFDHSMDVTILGLLLARQAGWAPIRLRPFAVGLLLHDIGKIFIDPSILNKPGKLDDAEFERMKAHPEIGYGMVRALLGEQLGPLPAQVAYQHHEKQDGTGYPRGLRGSNRLGEGQSGMIHDFGALAAVADVYDAIASDRPYRAGMPTDKACRIIIEAAGTHLNERAVGLFKETVAPYPTCSEIEILSGRWMNHRAIVVSSGARTFKRPRVRLVTDPDGNDCPPKDIDLRRFPKIEFRGVTAKRARDMDHDDHTDIDAHLAEAA